MNRPDFPDHIKPGFNYSIFSRKQLEWMLKNTNDVNYDAGFTLYAMHAKETNDTQAIEWIERQLKLYKKDAEIIQSWLDAKE